MTKKGLTKYLSIGAVTTAALFLAACSNQKSTTSAKNSKTEITMWHAMNGAQQKTLKQLTNKFEKENPNIKVKLENQGNYPQLQGKITSTQQNPNNLPTMTQAYPGWLYQAAQNKMLVNLTPYINNSAYGWGSVAKSNIRPELMKGAQINGVQYGIPFNKSIEVLTYNKTLLKKYGLKVPKTMAELKSVSKAIYEKSNHKIVGAGFDNLANYYVLGLKNEGQTFGRSIKLDSAASKKVINFYADGVRNGYFRTAGSERYLSGPFANEKVAMYIGTSAGESYTKMGVGNKFTYGVAPRPGEYTISQGTDLYVFNHASKAQKQAAMKYMKFLTSKSSQLTWANETGYIPVNDNVLNSKEYLDSKMKLPSVLKDSMKHLYSVPVAKNSDSAYNGMNQIMENILIAANKHQNVNAQIKAGQQKLDSAWRQ